jgi:hypothetical protein
MSTLDLYIKAINKINDHFEYANESIKDRAFIKKVLDDLTETLVAEQKTKQTITAQQIKDFRAETGAGLIMCRNALVYASGDHEAALSYVRRRMI